MFISRHLPLMVVSSFERRFAFARFEYDVLFEGKTQSGAISRWVMTITDHPRNGLVKYVLEKEEGLWARVLRINGLGLSEETAFMEWALGEIVAWTSQSRPFL